MGDLFQRFYATFLFERRYLFFLEGLGTTLFLTLGSFLLGTAIGAALCAALHARRPALARPARLLISFFLQIPTMVLLMVMVYIIFGHSGLPVLLIVLAGLTVKAGVALADIFHTALSTVDPGEVEAARTLGMSARMAFFHVTLPQVAAAALPLYQVQFVDTLQETSVVGYLAVMDLTMASDVVASRTLDALFGLLAITVIYFLLGLLGRALLGLLGRRRHLGGEVA